MNQVEEPSNDEQLEASDTEEVVIAELDDEELSALEQMQAKIEALQAELDETKAKLAEKDEEVLRVVAEGMNLQKRLQRDLDNTRKFSNDKIIKAMIPVMDSFDKALEVN